MAETEIIDVDAYVQVHNILSNANQLIAVKTEIEEAEQVASASAVADTSVAADVADSDNVVPVTLPVPILHRKYSKFLFGKDAALRHLKLKLNREAPETELESSVSTNVRVRVSPFSFHTVHVHNLPENVSHSHIMFTFIIEITETPAMVLWHMSTQFCIQSNTGTTWQVENTRKKSL